MSGVFSNVDLFNTIYNRYATQRLKWIAIIEQNNQ